jgi:uncharacterized membrane protein
MANTDESPEGRSEIQSSGLVLNRRYAIVAATLTFIVLVSALRSIVMQAPRHRWLLEPPWQSHQLTPLVVGFSFFFWGFTLWILFCFYRAARNRYERLLVGGSAVGFLLGIVEGFLPSGARIELEPASIAGFLVSFAAAMTLLVKLPSATGTPRPK